MLIVYLVVLSGASASLILIRSTEAKCNNNSYGYIIPMFYFLGIFYANFFLWRLCRYFLGYFSLNPFLG
jgi:hypothetical protein